jgi:hypothetical protein
MPLEERFRHAPMRGVRQALSSFGNYQFRSGQQPRLAICSEFYRFIRILQTPAITTEAGAGNKEN